MQLSICISAYLSLHYTTHSLSYSSHICTLLFHPHCLLYHLNVDVTKGEGVWFGGRRLTIADLALVCVRVHPMQ